MQLSKLTGAKIILKIFNEEDDSHMEYFSHDLNEFYQQKLSNFSKFMNKHYDFVQRMEDRFTKDSSISIAKDLEQPEGINLMNMFSQAKQNSLTVPEISQSGILLGKRESLVEN